MQISLQLNLLVKHYWFFKINDLDLNWKLTL